MILSVFTTLVIALVAMAPGWILMGGRTAHPGEISGAMAASLTLVMFATAMVGLALFVATGIRLPAIAMVAISALAIVWALRTTTGVEGNGLGLTGPSFEWQGITLGVIFLAYGLFVQAIAVRLPDDGSLIVHGWFNADWFKHLGHVAAIGNWGVPAVDNFNQGDTLYYYWLSYILPAAGLFVGNDGWSSLAAANSILVFLFASVFYGVLRKTGAGRNTVLLIGTIALFASAPIAFVYQAFFGIGFEGILAFPAAPKGPALLTLSQYIPQHLLALILLLGWFLLKDDPRLKWIALGALATAMAISVLLGAVVLLAYGLYRLWTGRIAAVPELSAMVVASGAAALLIHVVQIGNVGSSIESPLLISPSLDLPMYERIFNSINLVAGTVGLPFLISVLGLYYWRPTEVAEKDAKAFAAALIAAAFLAAIAFEAALTERLAIETRIRAVNLVGIANAIICLWLFARCWAAGQSQRLAAVAVLVLLVLIALPSAGLRTAWHGKVGDTFTSVIPADDRAVLNAMRNRTDPHAIVLQYPEPPVLAPESGDDAWGAILGQRAVTASLRATDYPLAEPRIASARRFYAGEPEPITPEIDLVYLSRILHPQTYDALRMRMDGESGFELFECYDDACLFIRFEASNP